jgi:SNF2 family DNA or RNA helicase
VLRPCDIKLFPPRTGGILAEEMGMGKTMEMLALILHQNSPTAELDPSQPGINRTQAPTLIVVPGSKDIAPLKAQWIEQTRKNFKENTFYVLQKEDMDKGDYTGWEEWSDYDTGGCETTNIRLFITTYHELSTVSKKHGYPELQVGSD